MCSRMKYNRKPEDVGKELGAVVDQDAQKIFTGSIFPNRAIHTITIENDGQKHLHMLQWGYHIDWMKAFGGIIFNARSESVLEKKMFAEDIRYRRCIVTVESFFERANYGKNYEFKRNDSGFFTMAGIFNKNKEVAILTTKPNYIVAQIHDRAPLIIPRKFVDGWLQHNPDKSYIANIIQKISPQSEENIIKIAV